MQTIIQASEPKEIESSTDGLGAGGGGGGEVGGLELPLRPLDKPG